MKVPREKKGQDGKREYTEWSLTRQRRVVVQRNRPTAPWYIYDLKGGLRIGGAKTVGHDYDRTKAEEKAIVYIKGIKS